jgi:hypothetical protein
MAVTFPAVRVVVRDHPGFHIGQVVRVIGPVRSWMIGSVGVVVSVDGPTLIRRFGDPKGVDIHDYAIYCRFEDGDLRWPMGTRDCIRGVLMNSLHLSEDLEAVIR